VPVDDLPPTPPTPTVTVAEGKIQVAIVAPDGLRKPVLPVFPSLLPSGSTAPAATAPATGAAPATSAAPAAVAAPEAPTSQPQGVVPPASQQTAPPAAPVLPPAPGTPQSAPTPEDQEEAVPCTPAAPGAPPAPGAPAAPGVPIAPGAPVAPPAPGAAGAPAPPVAPGAPAAAVAPGRPCIPVGRTLLPAKLLSPLPTTLYGYMVYEMAPADFKPPVQQPGAAPQCPLLLTAAPVPAGTWSDTRFVVGVDRCYTVRTVQIVGQITVESAATAPVCVKTVDTFPPAAPKNLQAVASEGTISLIWDSNSEADLAGYIVLRGPAGSDKLVALTPTPIKETTYRDTKVKAGVRYVYAVVAVDTATPQNISAQSNRVEETGR
jgi:hypothetical protein